MKFRAIGAFNNRSRLLWFLSTRPHRQPAISSVTFRGSHSLASLLAYNPNELSTLPDSPNIRSPAADNSKATNNSHRSEGQNAFRFAWRIRSSASLTFLAISSQLPFPRTTYPEATQTANQPFWVELTAAWCRRRLGASLKARATAFPERNWDQPALRILSNSHALRSVRRLPHSPASPKSGASRTLLRASSSRLPPPSRTHGPLELVTERWKSSSRQCHGLPATHHSQIICNSKTAEDESCRLPEPESQFWHLLFPQLTPPTSPSSAEATSSPPVFRTG